MRLILKDAVRGGSTVVRLTGLLLVLFLSAGCLGEGAAGSGAKVVAKTTVDDLAHQVPGIASNDSRLSTRLKELNGGANTVPDGVAQEFESGDGVLKQIIDGTEPGWGFACEAWEQGQSSVSPGAPATSQTLLETLQQQVDDQTVQERTVKFACAVNKFKEHATTG